MFLKKISKKIRDLIFFRRWSLRLKLTTLFVLIFGAGQLITSLFTYQYLSVSLQKEFDTALYNYSVDVLESISLSPNGDFFIEPPFIDREKVYPFPLGTGLMQIRRANGDVINRIGDFGTLQLPFKKDYQKLAKGEPYTLRTLTKLEGLPDKEAEEYRMISITIDANPVPQLVLQVAVPSTVLDNQLSTQKTLMQILLPLVLVISTFIGYFLSSRALAPVRNIINEARRMTSKSLSQRLRIPLAKDEIQDLALTWNQMLDRIEKAFESQDRFIADASHQLLTPLSTMRLEIEDVLRSPQTIAPKDIQSLLIEVDYLSHLVQDLLVLARVDAGVDSLTFQELYLDDLILAALGQVQKKAALKSVRLQFDISNLTGQENAHPSLRGEPELLKILLFNLLENAVKYSPSQSEIRICLIWQQEWQRVEIQDQGPGISVSERESIFARFHRAPNAGHEKGFGLGLSIAKKIADLHGAQIGAMGEEGHGGHFFFQIKNF